MVFYMKTEEKAPNIRPDKRRRRVNALKRIIIFSLVVLISIPYVLLGLGSRYLYNTNRNLQDITENLKILERRIDEINTAKEVVKEVEVIPDIIPEPVIVPVEEAESVTIEASFSLKQDLEGKKKIYLTFDDGPSAYTEDILEILDKYDVKATFFVLGKSDENAADRIKKIHDAGHTVGMHSYSHVYSDIYNSEEAFIRDFNDIYDYITNITGEEPFAYRFPGGSSNKVSRLDMKHFALLLKDRDIEFFDWNVHSGDGETGNLSKETICRNVINGIDKHDDSIVLMHDAVSRKSTVDALSLIIEALNERGDCVFLPITRETTPIQHRDFFE